MLTQDIVKNLFDYSDGKLFWKDSGSGRIRKEVGCRHHNGYIVTTIKGVQYPVHRIIWLYHNGYLPEQFIDHINRIKDDNRIENLREVSNSCNQKNTLNSVRNTSGIRGLSFINKEKVWRAAIRVNGKLFNLGNYKDKDEAVLARLATEQCLDWNKCLDDSPAYQYAIKRKLIKKRSL